MKPGPRTKLLLIVALFMLPMVASVLAYRYGHRAPTANHGELLLPPAQVSERAFARPQQGGSFSFGALRGRWILVAADSGACESSCRTKLVEMRQVRLAMGRDAVRVARVFVIDDGRAADAAALEPFAGMEVVAARDDQAFAPGTEGDRDHVYLVDPHGNVMMRWRPEADPMGMVKDLQRLLRASQIG